MDIAFVLPLGLSAWPFEMFEPSVVGLIFPFLSVAPWQLRGSPKMYAVGRQLQAESVERRGVGRREYSARTLRTVETAPIRASPCGAEVAIPLMRRFLSTCDRTLYLLGGGGRWMIWWTALPPDPLAFHYA
jgi:hypothetical protein